MIRLLCRAMLSIFLDDYVYVFHHQVHAKILFLLAACIIGMHSDIL